MTNSVKYTYTKGGLVKVKAINKTKVKDVLYFDFEDFVSNILDLVEVITNTVSNQVVLKKVLF